MNAEEKALRDAWISELWPTCHEADHEQRRREREAAALLELQAERRRVGSRRRAS